MFAGAAGIGLCLLLWGTRAYLAAKYALKYRIGGEYRRAWKQGTPDWVTRITPWLEFLGWLALLGSIAWWLLHPASVVGAARGVVCSCPHRFEGSHRLLTARAQERIGSAQLAL